MAKKTATIDLSATYTSKGVTHKLTDLIDWANENVGKESEDGEEFTPSKSLEDWIAYGILREKALKKDSKRHASGKLASRLYAPRLDSINTDKVSIPKALKGAVEQINEVEAKLAPEPKAKKAPAKMPKGSRARGEQVKAKHEAKQARRAKAKHADHGGAQIDV